MTIEKIDYMKYTAGELVNEKVIKLELGQKIEIEGFERLAQLRECVRDVQQTILNTGSEIPYNPLSNERQLIYTIGRLG